ncbi:Panacea domain-containing protein [uncultured Bacteroides sp.]|uniref:Panacea domain-containing protein n=1 Tax=uncultured Bacteroides sp. TaxID=162156 RepID=UPI002613EB30|nr:type II toxin-antitoxin system antitoxin SocA domain-containing protein [uncultured Bacteroides sp.]
MELTSIDYTQLISWLAYYKHKTILNKTQMQKILFMCYGLYLTNHSEPLFADDTPKAWPFGPVFPRSYKRYVEAVPKDLSIDDKKAFLKDKETLIAISKIVDSYYNYSANALSEWSHQKDSPWAKTVFSQDENSVTWNKIIDTQIIKEYFKSGRWKQGL